jgi:membrane protein implicated in regulation of membrane protease activity
MRAPSNVASWGNQPHEESGGSTPLKELSRGAEKAWEGADLLLEDFVESVKSKGQRFIFEKVICSILLFLAALAGFVLLVIGFVGFLAASTYLNIWQASLVTGSVLILSSFVTKYYLNARTSRSEELSESEPATMSSDRNVGAEKLEEGIDEVVHGVSDLVSPSKIVNRNLPVSLIIAATGGASLGWLFSHKQSRHSSTRNNDSTADHATGNQSADKGKFGTLTSSLVAPVIVSILRTHLQSKIQSWVSTLGEPKNDGNQTKLF